MSLGLYIDEGNMSLLYPEFYRRSNHKILLFPLTFVELSVIFPLILSSLWNISGCQ